MMEINYPDYVPVLRASDIRREGMTSEDGKRHCLEKWVRVVADQYPHDNPRSRPALERSLRRAIIKACQEMGLSSRRREFNPNQCKLSDNALPPINDYLGNTLAQIAEAFNRGMRSLGFTQIEECEVWP